MLETHTIATWFTAINNDDVEAGRVLYAAHPGLVHTGKIEGEVAGSPLHHAAHVNAELFLIFLLEECAMDPNHGMPWYDSDDVLGGAYLADIRSGRCHTALTPLNWAAEACSQTALYFLLKHGAHVEGCVNPMLSPLDEVNGPRNSPLNRVLIAMHDSAQNARYRHIDADEKSFKDIEGNEHQQYDDSLTKERLFSVKKHQAMVWKSFADANDTEHYPHDDCLGLLLRAGASSNHILTLNQWTGTALAFAWRVMSDPVICLRLADAGACLTSASRDHVRGFIRDECGNTDRDMYILRLIADTIPDLNTSYEWGTILGACCMYEDCNPSEEIISILLRAHANPEAVWPHNLWEMPTFDHSTEIEGLGRLIKGLKETGLWKKHAGAIYTQFVTAFPDAPDDINDLFFVD